MFHPPFGPAVWSALEMAPLSEKIYYDRTGLMPNWPVFRNRYRSLMTRVAGLMIVTGTRMNDRYGYAA